MIFSSWLLLLQKKNTDFLIFISYVMTLPNPYLFQYFFQLILTGFLRRYFPKIVTFFSPFSNRQRSYSSFLFWFSLYWLQLPEQCEITSTILIPQLQSTSLPTPTPEHPHCSWPFCWTLLNEFQHLPVSWQLSHTDPWNFIYQSIQLCQLMWPNKTQDSHLNLNFKYTKMCFGISMSNAIFGTHLWFDWSPLFLFGKSGKHSAVSNC